jgi:hypothetical protein
MATSVFVGSGIQSGKIRIRDKHPGFATLAYTMFNDERQQRQNYLINLESRSNIHLYLEAFPPPSPLLLQ